jgi:hypothetical protein
MRMIVVIAAAFALAACGGQVPAAPAEAKGADAPAAATADPARAAAAEITDANEMTVAQISSRLVGTWQSTQDDKSSLTITADGKWSGGYEGEVHTVSDWTIFAGDQPPAGAAGPFTPTSRYVEVKDPDGVFYYELGRITADAFDMYYTVRGNNLDYVRVN